MDDNHARQNDLDDDLSELSLLRHPVHRVYTRADVQCLSAARCCCPAAATGPPFTSITAAVRTTPVRTTRRSDAPPLLPREGFEHPRRVGLAPGPTLLLDQALVRDLKLLRAELARLARQL